MRHVVLERRRQRVRSAVVETSDANRSVSSLKRIAVRFTSFHANHDGVFSVIVLDLLPFGKLIAKVAQFAGCFVVDQGFGFLFVFLDGSGSARHFQEFRNVAFLFVDGLLGSSLKNTEDWLLAFAFRIVCFYAVCSRRFFAWTFYSHLPLKDNQRETDGCKQNGQQPSHAAMGVVVRVAGASRSSDSHGIGSIFDESVVGLRPTEATEATAALLALSPRSDTPSNQTIALRNRTELLYFFWTFQSAERRRSPARLFGVVVRLCNVSKYILHFALTHIVVLARTWDRS